MKINKKKRIKKRIKRLHSEKEIYLKHSRFFYEVAEDKAEQAVKLTLGDKEQA